MNTKRLYRSREFKRIVRNVGINIIVFLLGLVIGAEIVFREGLRVAQHFITIDEIAVRQALLQYAGHFG